MAVKKSSKSGDAAEAKAAEAGRREEGQGRVGRGRGDRREVGHPEGREEVGGAEGRGPGRAKAGGPPKKAGEVKLNDRQRDFLKKIKEAAEPGYLVGQKIEQRTIEALVNRKLLKKGPKHKESGSFHYVLTKAGEKHLAAHKASSAQS